MVPLASFKLFLRAKTPFPRDGMDTTDFIVVINMKIRNDMLAVIAQRICIFHIDL
jgi:hypothetical protein